MWGTRPPRTNPEKFVHPHIAAPSESLLAWMAEQVDEDLFIASLTIAEIRRGVLEKPAGRKRD
jgi:predicted nucleic acid-binding protein